MLRSSCQPGINPTYDALCYSTPIQCFRQVLQKRQPGVSQHDRAGMHGEGLVAFRGHAVSALIALWYFLRSLSAVFSSSSAKRDSSALSAMSASLTRRASGLFLIFP